MGAVGFRLSGSDTQNGEGLTAKLITCLHGSFVYVLLIFGLDDRLIIHRAAEYPDP
jgi:hypothetical protein